MDTIRKKFIDALKGKNTSEDIMKLDVSGELEKIFPHIIDMKKIGKCRFHAVDSFTHSINAIREYESILADESFLPRYIREIVKFDMDTVMPCGMTKRELLKLSIFLHDMGKPASMTVDFKGEVHFKGHERIGTEMVESVLEDFGLDEISLEIVYKYVRNHMILLHLYKVNNLSKDVLDGIFEYLGEDIAGVMLLGYSDVVCTRRLIYENENYGVLRVYMEYILTNYYYRFEEENI